MIIGSMREVERDAAPSHEVPPEQAEALFGEPRDDCDDSQTREDSDIEDGLTNEFRPVAFLDSGHEVAADVTVANVEGVDPKQQHNEHCKEKLRLPADIGRGEDFDGCGETRRGHANWDFLHRCPTRPTIGPTRMLVDRQPANQSDAAAWTWRLLRRFLACRKRSD